ncbi:MAG: hypothetical protein K6E16_09620, partial [Lachnospiraceae bacterium]|nr:hypothetical protein [Lachnospiraceae bacterium]
MAKQGKKSTTKKLGLNMRITLILFALIPLLVSSVTIGIVSLEKSKKEIKTYTHDSLVQVVKDVGNAFDTIANKNKEALKGYASAPVLTDALLDPENEEKIAKAQEYTLDYFGQLEGWEGLYICDWNSKVLTHPAAPVIGKVLREGDAL